MNLFNIFRPESWRRNRKKAVKEQATAVELNKPIIPPTKPRRKINWGDPAVLKASDRRERRATQRKVNDFHAASINYKGWCKSYAEYLAL